MYTKDKLMLILTLLHDDMIQIEYATPEFVWAFACNRDIRLELDDAKHISIIYGTNDDLTGRGFDHVAKKCN